MTDAEKPDWSWKVSDRSANEELNLLYEPGNWGDVIKGAWAVAVARALVHVRERPVLRVLDPFAGAPSYPLVEAAAQRLESLPPLDLLDLWRPFLERGSLASTATLIALAVRREGAEAALQVFDLDPARLRKWEATPGVEIASAYSGDELLEKARGFDLVLVDPYDLFERWERLIPRALARDPRTTVLFYLHNKAPRGANAHRRYLELRRRLAACLDEEGTQRRLLVGRIPSDAILPRAYHEVLLVAPPDLLNAVRSDLREVTLRLARLLTDEGSFEEPAAT